jgi:hypothetical protein
MEHRPTDAVRSYVDAIRLGNEISQGGLMINQLVGIACEKMGTIHLLKLLPSLMCEQMRPAIAELEHCDTNTFPWKEVERNEDHYVRAQLKKSATPFKDFKDWWQSRGLGKTVEEKHDLAVAQMRLLTTELALRCYRCDQGRAPKSLSALVPKYLQQVPSDPFSGHPLVYRPSDTNWLLYSVGPDRVDDGGRPASKIISSNQPIGIDMAPSNKNQNTGDLLYDSPW